MPSSARREHPLAPPNAPAFPFSSSTDSPPAPKRVKAGEPQARHDHRATPPGNPRAPPKLLLVKLKKMIIAAEWQRDGHPGVEFLNHLGLGSLTGIDWTLSDPSLASSVQKFVMSFNPQTHQSEVDGRVIKLTPEMISWALQIPNRGIQMDAHKRNVKNPDRLNLFRAGASGTHGFDHRLARDPSQARIFSLISEAIVLKASTIAGFTSARFLDWLSGVIERGGGNWAELLFENLCSKLLRLKKSAQGSFAGGPWIAHLLKVLREQAGAPAAGSSSIPRQRRLPARISRAPARSRAPGRRARRVPVSETQAQARLDLPGALGSILSGIEAEEDRIGALARRLREAQGRGEQRRLELRRLEEKNRVLGKQRERNRVLEKRRRWLEMELDSKVELLGMTRVGLWEGAQRCERIQRSWEGARAPFVGALLNIPEDDELDGYRHRMP